MSIEFPIRGMRLVAREFESLPVLRVFDGDSHKQRLGRVPGLHQWII